MEFLQFRRLQECVHSFNIIIQQTFNQANLEVFMHEPGCCFPIIDRFYCCLSSSCQISTTENIRLTALHCFRINVWESPFVELQRRHGILHYSYNINMTMLKVIMEKKEKVCFLLLQLSYILLCIYVITYLFLVPATVISFFFSLQLVA